MIKARNIEEFKVLQYMKKYLELEQFQLKAGIKLEGSRSITYVEATDKDKMKLYFYMDGKSIIYTEKFEDIKVIPV